MLSAAIRARSAFVRRRRPLGPSITSSRETPAPLEPSRWTPILPSLSKIQSLRHAHARRMAGSDQKWQKGIGVALTVDAVPQLVRLSARHDPRLMGVRRRGLVAQPAVGDDMGAG